MAVPLRPPMSHMMMEWSELPENSTLCDGSQHSAVTLPEHKRVDSKVKASAAHEAHQWRALRDHADKHSWFPQAVMSQLSGYLMMGVKKNNPSVDFRSQAKLPHLFFTKDCI